MKWSFVAILSFVFGLVSVAKLNSAIQSDTIEPVSITAAERVDLESLISTEEVPKAAFFDSFEEDEYFGGWLIAERFTGMNEVWTILLDRENDGKIGWNASVLTTNSDGTPNDEDNFASTQLKAERDTLTFTTRKIRGVQYFFEGRFLRHGKEFTQDEKVLTGTMRKVVKGKEIAKFSADFSYAEPHCFH